MKKEALKTGDVVELTSADLNKILEHNPMKNLIRQFDRDKPNRPKYWAILNKACDMAHNEKQKFTTNLFLCPLQGLREQIQRGQLKRIRYIETAKSPAQKFKDILRSNLKEIVKKALQKEKDETGKEFGQRLEKEINNKFTPTAHIVDQIKKEDNPNNFENAIIASASSDPGLRDYFTGLFSGNSWSNYLKNYSRIQSISSNIIFKEGASDTISKLCNNQLESDGIFFYEPHLKLLKKDYDIAYVIELEDILTLKIKSKIQNTGELGALLKEKRILSLKPIFSSRLQNMMGAYLSKIGTDDILSQNVLDLYKNYYKKDMYFSPQEYQEKYP
jgi:hypothetical protein